MLIGNGLTNGVINGIIYFFITSEVASQKGYIIGTLITNLILGIIVINLYPTLIRAKLKKNPDIKIPYTKENHIVAALYPSNKWSIRTINIVACLVITTIFTMGLIGCTCITEISVIVGSIMRGLNCAFFSIIAYYLSVVFAGTMQD
jgi:hypothetical protein